MLALVIAVAVVAVERYVSRRGLKPHEVFRDVGWLVILFAFIEFAWLFAVESGTLLFGSAMRPFWFTMWPLFKNLLFEAAVGVFLVLLSTWLESAGVAELYMSLMRRRWPKVGRLLSPPARRQEATAKCDVEW